MRVLPWLELERSTSWRMFLKYKKVSERVPRHGDTTLSREDKQMQLQHAVLRELVTVLVKVLNLAEKRKSEDEGGEGIG